MKKIIAVLLGLLCLLMAAAAIAEPAEDITALCSFRAGSGRDTLPQCYDRRYKTHWQSLGGKAAYLQVTLPEGQSASGVMTKWFDAHHGWQVQVEDEDGEWVTYAQSEGLYYSEYLPLPQDAASFRITTVKGRNSTLSLCEVYVYGMGELPAQVQQWQPSADKADLLLIVAHPDDEVLWFGGTLPHYAGEYGMKVQVAMMTPNAPYRRLELLDCLWTCGVRQYPVWGSFNDTYTSKLKEMYKRWGDYKVNRHIVEWIRRFRPDVLITHDLDGEYGHAAHKVCADATLNCLALAADETKYRDSAKAYGVWEVPKCYLHLYPENVVDMDWRRPLNAFGGQTGFQVAEAAFRCHISQQKTDYHVEDWGSYDNSLFGLAHTLVGDDVNGNDFFENLPNAPVQ